MKKIIVSIVVGFFLLSLPADAKKVKIDCSMINSDIAIFLQKTLRDVRRTSPPENACGVSVSIKIGHIDANLESESYTGDSMGVTSVDFRKNFDFYFNGMRDHLSTSFKEKNLGYAPKEIRIKNVFRYEAGANHHDVTPASTVVIARNFEKKTYQTPKEHWGMDEAEDRTLEEAERCEFAIFSDIVWVVSEPRNDVSGFVNAIDKEGKKKKLKKGKVKFTREGPNNGHKIEFEAEIGDGYYKTYPELPSGHYRVELKEPEECEQLVDENWIFKSGNMMAYSFDVNCEEKETFYTITTKQKTTRTIKPIEKYRGISKTLKNIEEDKHLYYTYIDADNALIYQYHVDKKSTRKIHKEAYKLNMQSCQYELVTNEKMITNLGGSPILKSEDAGWGFEDNTKIYVDLPSSNKRLSFSWGKLHDSGYYSNQKKYKEEIPKIVKTMMGKVNDMATQLRNETKNSKGVEIFKSFYDYPGTPRDVQCGGKVAMESLMIPPLDALQDPDIEFKIKIRPSTQAEIKIMKSYMKNNANNPNGMMQLFQMMQTGQ